MDKINRSRGRQTGSEWGTFSKWDKHPSIDGYYFLSYRKGKNGTLELWKTSGQIREYDRLRAISRASEKCKKSRSCRRKTDIAHRMKEVCRSRIYHAVNRLKKHNADRSRTVDIIGCSYGELKNHIESKFKDGMSWDNYGDVWHIDHIVPLSCATNIEGIELLSHYSNLQPMFALDNLRKSNNLELSND